MPGQPLQSALAPAIPGSEAFLIAIGRLVAASALLERELDWWMYEFIGPDQRTAQIIGNDLDRPKRLNLLLSLARNATMPNQCLSRLVHLTDGVNELYDRRNQYIHGTWASGTNESKRHLVCRSTESGKWKWRFVEVTAHDVLETAERFNAIASDLSALRDEYGASATHGGSVIQPTPPVPDDYPNLRARS
jgi:hypothetical protein